MTSHPVLVVPNGAMPKQTVTPASEGWIFSASQIELWEGESGCQRKWAEQYINGERTSTAASDLGTECHNSLERMAKTGEWAGSSAVSRILQSAWAFLPHLPNPRWVAEGEFDGLMIGSYRFRGKLDLERDQRAGYAVSAATKDKAGGGNLFDVIDLKTCGGFRYAKTVDYLATKDVQALVYAAAIKAKAPHLQAINARWLYASKQRIESQPRDFRIEYDSLYTARIEKLKKTCSEIRSNAKTLSVESFPKNLAACGAYGGCPYRGKCGSENPLTAWENAVKLYQPRTKEKDACLTTIVADFSHTTKKGELSKPLTGFRFRRMSSLRKRYSSRRSASLALRTLAP